MDANFNIQHTPPGKARSDDRTFCPGTPQKKTAGARGTRPVRRALRFNGPAQDPTSGRTSPLSLGSPCHGSEAIVEFGSLNHSNIANYTHARSPFHMENVGNLPSDQRGFHPYRAKQAFPPRSRTPVHSDEEALNSRRGRASLTPEPSHSPVRALSVEGAQSTDSSIDEKPQAKCPETLRCILRQVLARPFSRHTVSVDDVLDKSDAFSDLGPETQQSLDSLVINTLAQIVKKLRGSQ